jgi:hypothetical protein
MYVGQARTCVEFANLNQRWVVVNETTPYVFFHALKFDWIYVNWFHRISLSVYAITLQFSAPTKKPPLPLGERGL